MTGLTAYILAKKYADKKDLLGLKTKVVNSLPSVGDEKTIYLLPISKGDKTVYEQWLYTTVNGTKKWIEVGDTDIPLEDYLKKSEFATFKTNELTPALTTLTNNIGAETTRAKAREDAIEATIPTQFKTINNNSILGTGNIAIDYADLTNKPTTISGYGITDAKIEGGTITLGDQTLTPLTGLTLKTVNGSSLIGTGNVEVKTYQPFPNGDLNGTLQQVVSAIMAFPTRAQGMAYLGTIKGASTPFGYGNVECTVTFMTNSIAVIATSSSDIYPYHWEYNTAQNDYKWRTFITLDSVGDLPSTGSYTVKVVNGKVSLVAD